MNPKYCLQCGYEIVEQDNGREQPAGFCSEGCAEVHIKIHDMEFEQARRGMKAGK